jgi:hypothetical protein
MNKRNRNYMTSCIVQKKLKGKYKLLGQVAKARELLKNKTNKSNKSKIVI